jgi:hypothetical protein
MDEERQDISPSRRTQTPRDKTRQAFERLARYHNRPDLLELAHNEANLASLMATGLVHRLTSFRLTKQSVPPGLLFIEIPNHERNDPATYGLSNVQAGQAMVDMEDFIDPYPNIENWFEGTEDRPPYISYNDGQVIEHSEIELYQKEGFDAYGEYLEKTGDVMLSSAVRETEWGIRIYSSGITALADWHIGDELGSVYKAWMVVFRAILYHEYFHFLSEHHCRRLTPQGDAGEKYAIYSDAFYANQDDAIEEAVANAYAYRMMKRQVQSTTMTYIKEMFDDQDEPYSKYSLFTKGRAFDRGLAWVALQQEDFEPFKRSRSLNLNAATKFKHPVNESVPLYLIEDGRPKAIVGAQRFGLHPGLRSQYSGNGEALWAMGRLVEKLNAENTTTLASLDSTPDEKHMVLKDPNVSGNNVALFTQLQDHNGIWMVYYGPKQGCEWLHHQDFER